MKNKRTFLTFFKISLHKIPFWKSFLVFFALLLLIGGLTTVVFFNNKKHQEKKLFSYSLDYAGNNQAFFLDCKKEKLITLSGFSCADFTKEENLKKMLININKPSLYLYQRLGGTTAMNLKFQNQTKKTGGIVLETNVSQNSAELSHLYYEALTQKGSYAFLGEEGNDLLLLNNKVLREYAQKHQADPETNDKYWWATELYKNVANPTRIYQKEFLQEAKYNHQPQVIQLKLQIRLGNFQFIFKPLSTEELSKASKTHTNAIINYLYFLFQEKKIFYVLANPANFWMQAKRLLLTRKNRGQFYDLKLMKTLEKLNLNKDLLEVNSVHDPYDSLVLVKLNQFLPDFLLDLKSYQNDNSAFSYLNKYFLFSYLEQNLQTQITSLSAQITKFRTEITELDTQIKVKIKLLEENKKALEKTTVQAEKEKLTTAKETLENDEKELNIQKKKKNKDKEIKEAAKKILTTKKFLLNSDLSGKVDIQDFSKTKLTKMSLVKNDDFQLIDFSSQFGKNNQITLNKYFPFLPSLAYATDLRSKGVFLRKNFYKTTLSQTSSDGEIDILSKYKKIWLFVLVFLAILVFLMVCFYNFLGILMSVVGAFFVALSIFLFSVFGVQLTFLTIITIFIATLLFLLLQMRFLMWFKTYFLKKTTLAANWKHHWNNNKKIWNYFALFLFFALILYLLGSKGQNILYWLGIDIETHLFFFWGKTLLLLWFAAFTTYFCFFYPVMFFFFLGADRFFKSCLGAFEICLFVSFTSQHLSRTIFPQKRKLHIHTLLFFVFLTLLFLIIFLNNPFFLNVVANKTVWTANSESNFLVYPYLSHSDSWVEAKQLNVGLKQISAQDWTDWEIINIFDGQKWVYGLEASGDFSSESKMILTKLGFSIDKTLIFYKPFITDLLFVIKLWAILGAVFACFFFFKFGFIYAINHFFLFILRFCLLLLPFVAFNLGFNSAFFIIWTIFGVLTSFLDYAFYDHFKQKNLAKTDYQNSFSFSLFPFSSLLFLFFVIGLIGFLILSAKFWFLAIFVFLLLPLFLSQEFFYRAYFFPKINQKWLVFREKFKKNIFVLASTQDQEGIVKGLND